MSQLNFAFLMAIECVLEISSVSGRTGNYAPKCWAMLTFGVLPSEGSIKLKTTKRSSTAVKALGNGAVVKATVKIETANEKRTFDSNGKETEYYETVTKYTITSVDEVLEQGEMPKAREDKAESDGTQKSDMLPD